MDNINSIQKRWAEASEFTKPFLTFKQAKTDIVVLLETVEKRDLEIINLNQSINLQTNQGYRIYNDIREVFKKYQFNV